MNKNEVYKCSIEKFANLFNLKLGERFNIITEDGKFEGIYMFTKDGLSDFTMTYTRNEMLLDVLKGKYIIEKFPWKPKEGEVVYIIEYDYFKSSYVVKKINYIKNEYLHILYRLGLLFKTEKEAFESMYLSKEIMDCDDYIEWGNKNEKRLED